MPDPQLHLDGPEEWTTGVGGLADGIGWFTLLPFCSSASGCITSLSSYIEEIESQLERSRYELEIAQRLLGKAQDEAAQQTWQTQVDVLEMVIGMAEGDLAEQREELCLCEAMITEIEADLALGQPENE